MAATERRTTEHVRQEIELERQSLAAAVEQLRHDFKAAVDGSRKLKSNLPLVLLSAATVGFVVAGGIGATARYLARPGGDAHRQARAGRLALGRQLRRVR